ncbi:O-antigen ligase family protein [Asticcacaulis biprosthecium]|uniref:O-antigen ligase family protein n=1 Tax=Asticcacaulis biprosthecium TaxID=76891 RepID=UPI0003103685|nr:O-antigen ligase family protein [Asticcacaulis biprosthecium]
MTANGAWEAVKAHYAEWWLLFGLTWLPIFAWVVPTAAPAMLFIWGIPLLVYLGRLRKFWPAAAITFAMVVLGFLRSDFVAYLLDGKGLAAAFATKYWFAPTFAWLVSWAVIAGFDGLPEDKAPRLATWFGWLMIGLSVVQVLESISGMGLRTGMNNAFAAAGNPALDASQPEMLIVHMINCNVYLTLLFWPLAFWFEHRRQYGQIAVLAIAVVAGAIGSDANAHLMAMAASGIVFFAVRYWPNALRRLQPHKLLAGLSAGSLLVLPLIFYAAIRSGFFAHVKGEILPSWAARLDIYAFTVERSLEKPWWGWGYETARTFDPMIPNHPHNLSLQAWMELGLPGLFLLAALWFAIFWLSGPKDGYGEAKDEGMREISAADDITPQTLSVAQRAAPFILAAASGYFVINMVSYGLWRSWYYCLGAVLVAIFLLVIKAVAQPIKLRA